MIENELDNGPQEPPVESAKKNNTRTLVKRTLAIAGLALVVYFLYSIVHLFVSPDRNIQQIYLVPEDAAFIIQSSAPIDDWAKFSGSATWQCLKRSTPWFEAIKCCYRLWANGICSSRSIKSVPVIGIS